MRSFARTLLRHLAAALPALALLGPARAAAQPIALDASAACLPGATCDALRFTLALPAAAPAPASIATLRFTLLTPGWSFIDGPTAPFAAEDALGFGPFGTADVGDAGASAASGAVAFIDFLAQATSFELLPGTSGWLQLAVSAGTEPIAFAYEGTDLAGATFAGTVGGPAAVVPEPSTVLLLAGGLALLAALTARRRAAA